MWVYKQLYKYDLQQWWHRERTKTGHCMLEVIIIMERTSTESFTESGQIWTCSGEPIYILMFVLHMRWFLPGTTGLTSAEWETVKKRCSRHEFAYASSEHLTVRNEMHIWTLHILSCLLVTAKPTCWKYRRWKLFVNYSSTTGLFRPRVSIKFVFYKSLCLWAFDFQTVHFCVPAAEHSILVESDSVSYITTISSSFYKWYLKELDLHPTVDKFQTYFNSQVLMQRSIFVDLKANNKTAVGVAVYVSAWTDEQMTCD